MSFFLLSLSLSLCSLSLSALSLSLSVCVCVFFFLFAFLLASLLFLPCFSFLPLLRGWERGTSKRAFLSLLTFFFLFEKISSQIFKIQLKGGT